MDNLTPIIDGLFLYLRQVYGLTGKFVPTVAQKLNTAIAHETVASSTFDILLFLLIFIGAMIKPDKYARVYRRQLKRPIPGPFYCPIGVDIMEISMTDMLGAPRTNEADVLDTGDYFALGSHMFIDYITFKASAINRAIETPFFAAAVFTRFRSDL